ncbi:MAG: NrfD/PsrC family molybdoenzyme membrane anchor subunit [Blastocatellales bacterium]
MAVDELPPKDVNREPDITPVIGPGHSFASVTDKISSIVLTRGLRPGWLVGFSLAVLLVLVLGYAVGYLLIKGVGIWGINIPVAWGFAIVNFVWWIGIGHAGTLISAILLLLNQKWRTSINRFAEAMTIFAVACAGMFPLLHLGRPWLFYWLFPYPNIMNVQPQFRSPLVWDVFAVSTYFTVSVIFWFIGLIPDLGTLRDRARSRAGQVIYGMLAMGWRGSARHWKRYEIAYLLLAGLATPLVVSVHTVVSFDFTIAILPGWHSTIFPPYFVAGAIFSGFAMVLTIAIPLRWYYGLEDFVTLRHLDNCGKLMLVTGLIVAYGYMSEIFLSWYSKDKFEWFMTRNRIFGPYWMVFWSVMLLNVGVTQLLWSRRVRRSATALFLVSLAINAGMWIERYMIVVTSLTRDFMTSSWGTYSGTIWDYAVFVGTIGFFVAMMFLFVRLLPAISISEVRTLLPQAEVKGEEEEARV